MRRLAAATVLALSCCLNSWAQLDSASNAVLGQKLDEYSNVISFYPLSEQYKEVDFLIESCKQKDVRDFTAGHLYTHFLESKVMGSEGVAVHIFDSWFADGKAEFPDETSFLTASLHASLNRPTLIGCKAPVLTLKDMDLSEDRSLPSNGRTSLLIFFSSDCSKCKLECMSLSDILSEGNWPIDIYAVYLGDDRNGWKEFLDDYLKIDASDSRVFNLWDPEGTSDMTGLYGIIQTPRILLTDEDGIILGRNLDADAVEHLLSEKFTFYELDYGSEESKALFEEIFADCSAEEICRTIDHVAESSLERGGRDMFRQMTGDMMYFLNSGKGEGYVEACDYLIEKYIDGNRVWNNPDDSLKILGLASMLKDLHGKNAVGSPIAGIRVFGTLEKGKGKGRSGMFKLGKFKKRQTALLFYTPGCGDCSELLEQAGRWADKKHVVLEINVETARRNMKDEDFNTMMESFDLSSLPHLMILSEEGKISGRYLTSFPGR